MIGKTSVLLVDDDGEYATAVAKVLRRRGLDVELAGDGEAALDALAARPFDVVVLDLRMPRRDGLSTLTELRRRGCRSPVLILSGHADVEDARRALAHGAVDVLVKPCGTDNLLSAITDAAERARLEREIEELEQRHR
jgi:DNA-binding NtrC family response regulator